MGCCLGGLAKLQSKDSKPYSICKTLPRKKAPQPSTSGHRKRQWSSSPQTMDNKSGNSHSIETQLSPVPTSLSEEIVSVEESGNGCLFVNHGAIGWHVKRKEWVGDQSKKPRRVPREPIISWCTTYDDLLSTSQPFSQPIPLAEMVDFLVDIWHEGLNN